METLARDLYRHFLDRVDFRQQTSGLCIGLLGIILCAKMDALEVEFSLKSKANPIGVAEYQLVPQLPRELKGKLPTARQLSEALQWPIVKK